MRSAVTRRAVRRGEKAIIGRVDEGADAVELRALVAEALDDPPLELAFEVDRGSKFFVDSRGDPIDATSPMPGRSATALQHRGETVAYIVHDAGLETDPELVRAAGQAVLMALESGRLESELRSKTAELQRASGRIVAAGEAERRKIERDLHDGAQQRLTAIQIKLSLLRDRIDAAEFASEHAGQSARVTVTLQRVGHDIVFEAVDDGPGFRPYEVSDTLGLTSIRDRVGAIGGELEIVSSPQTGTCVRGRVPDEAVARAEHR